MLYQPEVQPEVQVDTTRVPHKLPPLANAGGGCGTSHAVAGVVAGAPDELTAPEQMDRVPCRHCGRQFSIERAAV